jgi:hypothetical protein
MPPKSLGKKPAPAPNLGTAIGASTPKAPKAPGKSKEQLDYLNSHLSDFLTHQAAGSLDRFWPRVYDGWHKKWPVAATADDVKEYDSLEGAILVLRTDNNQVRVITFVCLELLTIQFLNRGFACGSTTKHVPLPNPRNPT